MKPMPAPDLKHPVALFKDMRQLFSLLSLEPVVSNRAGNGGGDDMGLVRDRDILGLKNCERGFERGEACNHRCIT